jgi:hypothetical protein
MRNLVSTRVQISIDRFHQHGIQVVQKDHSPVQYGEKPLPG